MRSRVNPAPPATQSKLFLSKAKAYVASFVRRNTVARAEANAATRDGSQGHDHESKTSHTNAIERAISEKSEKLQRQALSGGVVKKVSSRPSLDKQDLKQASLTHTYLQAELDRSLREPPASKSVGERDDLDIDNQEPESFALSSRAGVDDFVTEFGHLDVANAMDLDQTSDNNEPKHQSGSSLKDLPCDWLEPYITVRSYPPSPASSASSFNDSGYASSGSGSEDSHMSDVDDQSLSPQDHGAAARRPRCSKFHSVFGGGRQQYRDSDIDGDELAEDEAISMDFKWFKLLPNFRFPRAEAAPKRTFVTRPTDHYETPLPAQDASPPPSPPRPTAQHFTPPPAQPPPAFNFPTAATATPPQPPQVAIPSPPRPATFNIATGTPFAANGTAKQPVSSTTAPARAPAAPVKQPSFDSSTDKPTETSPSLALPKMKLVQAQMSNPSDDESAALSGGFSASAATSSLPSQPINLPRMFQAIVEDEDEKSEDMQPARPHFMDTPSQARTTSGQSSQPASAKTATKDQTPLSPPPSVPRADGTSPTPPDGATGLQSSGSTTTSADTASPVAASAFDVQPSGNKRVGNHPGDKVDISTEASKSATNPMERKKKDLRRRPTSAPSTFASKPSFSVRSGLDIGQKDLNQLTPGLLKTIVFTFFAACFASLDQYAHYSVNVLELKLGKGKANAELAIMEASMKVLFNYLTTATEDGVQHARWWPESKLLGKDSVVCIQKAQVAYEAARPLMKIEAAQSHATLRSIISMLKDMKNGKVRNDLPQNQDTTMAGGENVNERSHMAPGNSGSTAAGVDVFGVSGVSSVADRPLGTRIGSDIAAGLLPGSTLAMILGQGKSSSTARETPHNSAGFTNSRSFGAQPTQAENHGTAMAVDGHVGSAKPQNFAVQKQKKSTFASEDGLRRQANGPAPKFAKAGSAVQSEGNEMDVDVAGTQLQKPSTAVSTTGPGFASTPSGSSDAPTESFHPLKDAAVGEVLPIAKSWMAISEDVVETMERPPRGRNLSYLLTDTEFLQELNYVGERIEQAKTFTCSLKHAIHSKKYRTFFRMLRKKVSDMHVVLEKLRIRYGRSAPQALQMAAL
ncbi:hypothetical protein LTR86_000259 [Recurvomyces mirabilis]|nr:hypothetical protein LTR86_000259 [Recurvomyces mirabilis]